MKIFVSLLIIFFTNACVIQDDDSAKRVDYLVIGYDLSVNDQLESGNMQFLIRNDSCFTIQQNSLKASALDFITENTEIFRPLIDSLPSSVFKEGKSKIGNLITENDAAPWFVNVHMNDSSLVSIGSEQLPDSFKNYSDLVVSALSHISKLEAGKE